jgi:hypothetical protein
VTGLAGGGIPTVPTTPSRYLFTPAELNAFLQQNIPADTGALIHSLVYDSIRGVVNARGVNFDAIQDISPLRLVALTIARKMLISGTGQVSQTSYSIDDYSESSRYQTSTTSPSGELTDSDVSWILRELGITDPSILPLSPTGAFTIRPGVREGY